MFQEADERLAAAEAARELAEMRVWQEQKALEQLKFAFELQRLAVEAAAATTTARASDDATEPTEDDADNSVHRFDTRFHPSVLKRENLTWCAFSQYPSCTGVATNSTFCFVCRELCEQQVLIIQRENERLRAQLFDLTNSQAERRSQGSASDAVPSPRGVTGGQSHTVITAQIAIAEQQAADYQSRMSKLSSFFAASMHDLRAITQEVLGWKCVPIYFSRALL